MLVTGVQHDPVAVLGEQLGEPAGVLEDARVTAWLEQVDLHRWAGHLTCTSDYLMHERVKPVP